ncbi:MAG: UDP-N-acetylmuramoyl-L-alanyl-D-glutamate--2,6-diaminopimelate ligase [Acutalibacteraceae bacterium]
MKLSDLLRSAGINFYGEDKQIDFISDDSRNCRKNTLFVCHEKGEEYLETAKQNGAVAVVAGRKLESDCFVCKDTRKAYSTLCREYFSRPDQKIKMIAVTGTNGKTSTALALCYILNLCGMKAGIIGTVENSFERCRTTSLTTPDCFELYCVLSHMAEHNYDYCVMEASSQGLSQQRLYPIEFEAGIFTNLTEDHLDYHKTFENYKLAKRSLFEHCKRAVINFDSEFKDEFINACKGAVTTYSVKSDEADYTAKNIRVLPDSTSYELVSNCDIHRIRLRTRGDFWVQNSLAAVVCAIGCGISQEKCAYAIGKFSGVKGRMELVETDRDFKIFIDYAHTPDGLSSALLSLKKFCSGRLILVFGCGGDRETQKRSKMGEIAVRYADVVFVTSDNPRTEDPQKIIDDILLGVKKSRTPVYISVDRKKAIADALKTAKKNDIVLLAGKGHETYQLKGGEKLPFDERKIIKEILNS